jgi:hypothetical protein
MSEEIEPCPGVLRTDSLKGSETRLDGHLVFEPALGVDDCGRSGVAAAAAVDGSDDAPAAVACDDATERACPDDDGGGAGPSAAPARRRRRVVPGGGSVQRLERRLALCRARCNALSAEQAGLSLRAHAARISAEQVLALLQLGSLVEDAQGAGGRRRAGGAAAADAAAAAAWEGRAGGAGAGAAAAAAAAAATPTWREQLIEMRAELAEAAGPGAPGAPPAERGWSPAAAARRVAVGADLTTPWLRREIRRFVEQAAPLLM